MKTARIILLFLIFLSTLPYASLAETFRIDGYVLSRTNLYPVENEIVAIKSEAGVTIEWFQTNQNGLYSGDFDLNTETNTFITVEVLKMCDGEISVFAQNVALNASNLICNFLVCDFFSCKANFNVTQIDGNDLIFKFEDISTGNVTSWFWDFGDQQTSTLQHPVHQYTSPGHYTVTLQITTDLCDDDQHRDIFVSESNCLALFSYEQQNDGDELWVQFQNESTGNYSQLDWDFGDQSGSDLPSPKHLYDGPGNYHVKLHIWGQNCNHEIRKIITLSPASTCHALFTALQDETSQPKVQFTDVSIGDIETWLWDFGDGQSSQLQHPQHLYSNTGIYEVTLTISGIHGTSSFTRLVEVIQVFSCQASFTFIQEFPEDPSISFVNQSEGDNFSCAWKFGDGNSSFESNPSHSYNEAGEYVVELIITDVAGCADTATETITILPPLAISGNVLAGNNLISYGDIYLFKETSSNVWKLSSQKPMGDGNFDFTGISPGNYLVLAIPVFDFSFPQIPKYLPTYYNGASHWSGAEPLSTQNLPESVTIHLRSYNSFFDGDGSVSGKVNLLSSDSGLPLVLYLSAENDEIFDFTFADTSGNFSFDNIPYGTYKLYPEKAGKSSEVLTVEINDITPFSQHNVFVEEDFRIYPDLTNVNESDMFAFSVRPNPSTRNVNIDFKGGFSKALPGNLTLLGIDGKTLRTYAVNHNQIKLDISDLADGFYVLRYCVGNERHFTKLVIKH